MNANEQTRYDIGMRAVGTLEALLNTGELDYTPETRERVRKMIEAYDATFQQPPRRPIDTENINAPF